MQPRALLQKFSSVLLRASRLAPFSTSIRFMSSETAVSAGARHIRIYTRTGDKGQSSLYNGTRASKASAVFDALGDIDELNANLGVALEHCRLQSCEYDDLWAQLQSRLQTIQSRLLDLGSAVATPLDDSSEDQLRRAAFPDAAVDELETWIDEMESTLPTLRNFILPSGGLASSHLHVCRTVCRRSERSIVGLPDGSCPPVVGRFLNRLSDFLFVAARFAAAKAGVPETVYKKGATDTSASK